jgi:hypothetical protein
MKTHFFYLVLATTALSFCYPTHCFPQEYAVVFGENVNIRSDASSKASIVGKIEKSLSIVKFEGESNFLESVYFGNCYLEYPWYQINQNGNLSGWIYGAYMLYFDDAASAGAFIDRNNAFRTSHAGTYTLDYAVNGLDTYFELELLIDGKINILISAVEGDHVVRETGVGRYFINTKDDTFNFYGSTQGEFAPDGYSWAEYFALAKGHVPSDEELAQYIKEKGSYKCVCDVRGIPMERFSELMKPEQ